MKTREEFWRLEGDMGYKLPWIRTGALSPYAGIGYRHWERGKDALPDYAETYTWYYAALGLNYALNLEGWSIGADAAVQFPFNLRMKTDIAGLVDKAHFKLKSRPGFRVELPITYDIYQRPDAKRQNRVFLFTTPYYQYWKIGKSDDVTLTQDGVPVGIAFEPDSTTDTYGARVGIGVSF